MRLLCPERSRWAVSVRPLRAEGGPEGPEREREQKSPASADPRDADDPADATAAVGFRRKTRAAAAAAAARGSENGLLDGREGDPFRPDPPADAAEPNPRGASTAAEQTAGASAAAEQNPRGASAATAGSAGETLATLELPEQSLPAVKPALRLSHHSNPLCISIFYFSIRTN